MPIGLPRILYCWSEDLPAQWIDLQNFIFRRRLLFLMGNLDNELCNQICGLLINIHMEDKIAELEKQNDPYSGLSGSSPKTTFKRISKEANKKSVEDLLKSEGDLSISENKKLEQFTLQKITKEWLNWNAQFFNYSDDPYHFYYAEILAKSFELTTEDAQSLYSQLHTPDLSCSVSSWGYRPTWRKIVSQGKKEERTFPFEVSSRLGISSVTEIKGFNFYRGLGSEDEVKVPLLYKNLRIAQKDTLLENRSNIYGSKLKTDRPERSSGLIEKFKQNLAGLVQTPRGPAAYNDSSSRRIQGKQELACGVDYTALLSNLANDELWGKISEPTNQMKTAEKALSEKEYRLQIEKEQLAAEPKEYIDLFSRNFEKGKDARNPSAEDPFFKQYSLGDESYVDPYNSKKVLILINSYGGSVGSGITLHDALQYIRAGTSTLCVGVSASAASVVLAGGSVGERYITPNSHTMIHQPETELSGQASDIWIDSNEILKIRQEVADIYSLSTNRPRHKIVKDLDRDNYLTPTETIYYGLADEIATSKVVQRIVEKTHQAWKSDTDRQQKLLESRVRLLQGYDTERQPG